MSMRNLGEQSARALAKGQLWKLNDGYVYIVEPGQRLVQYKILKQQQQKSVLTRLLSTDKLRAFLQAQAAELVESAATN